MVEFLPTVNGIIFMRRSNIRRNIICSLSQTNVCQCIHLTFRDTVLSQRQELSANVLNERRPPGLRLVDQMCGQIAESPWLDMIIDVSDGDGSGILQCPH